RAGGGKQASTAPSQGKRKARAQQDAAVALIEKNASYAILHDDEGEADEKARKKAKKAKKKDKKEREKHLRANRGDAERDGDEDDDGINRDYLEQRHRR
ncbi:hypothetical protein SARC_14563, partial [Sphaeroforma arctica JP610]